MKKLLVISAVLSVLALPAMAASDNNKGNSGNRDRQEHNQSKQEPQKSKKHEPQKNDKAQSSKRQYSYDGKRRDSYHSNAWRAPRGHDAKRHWRNGDRLPSAYRDRSYVVNYRDYNLNRPPYGYEWVRVSNSVFLVRQSNGLISSIVLNLFY
jgi:Ni/Co efflux regulator RcnB